MMSKKLLSLGRKQISKFNSSLDNMDLKQKQGDKAWKTLYQTKVQLDFGRISEPTLDANKLAKMHSKIEWRGKVTYGNWT